MAKFEVVNQEFVNTIIGEAKEVVKSATIGAIELTETKTVVSKEGEETGYAGDFLVVGNGGAAVDYIIKRVAFLGMYELVEGNTYRKNARTLAYKMNRGFSVIPSWNNGQVLSSEEQGGYLMIYGEGDFNVCSFDDFAKTYVFVK